MPVISDVLSQAIEDIREYLQDPVIGETYREEPDLYRRITELLDMMEALRMELGAEK